MFFILIILSAFYAFPAPPAYPLKISANNHYLTDQNNSPFFLHGDSPWSLMVQLTTAEAVQYLDNRRQKGFNTLLVNLLEHKFTTNAPRNRNGDGPFLTAGDFSTPNDRYFAHADTIVQLAADRGMQLLLAPIYLGYAGTDEGWYNEVLASGTAKCRQYGQYVGNRYKSFPNIIWVMGADRSPDAALAMVRECALGIQETDNIHTLYTAHCSREN
jgi:hypothetical protein